MASHHHHHHIAVIPFPFSSHPSTHFNATKHLASLLLGASGCSDVHFTFFGTPKSNASLSISSAGYDNIKPFDIVEAVPPAESKMVGIKAIDEDVGFFMRVAPQAVRNAVATAESEIGRKVTCIIGDPFLGFLPDMAKEMNVPWVACWISGAHSLQAHVHTDLIREKIGVHDDARKRKDEHLSFIPGLSHLRVQDLPDGVVSGDLQSPFAEMLRRIGKLLSCANAVIVNTCEDLDPELIADMKTNINPKFLCPGPFYLLTPPASSNLDDPHQCLAWLDQQPARSIVYIGFGNIACPSAPEMAAIAAAVEEAGVKFLWSLKPDQMSSCLPTSFVDNARESGTGLFVPWAPQIAVLEHPATGAFMTHFGWNSLIESVIGGVPMIGRPLMADQPVTARMAEAAWGIGMVVADPEGGVFTKERVARALEKVLKNEEDKKRIMEAAGRLKELIKTAVGPKGSSEANCNILAEIVCGGGQFE